MSRKYVAYFLIATAVMIVLNACSPRTLSGRYSTTQTSDLAGTSYVFSRDSTFESTGWTCFGSDTGAGRYTLTRDSLILVYDTLEISSAAVCTIDTVPSTGDSCVFNLSCAYGEEQLMFVAVEGMGTTGTKYFTLTDTGGRAVMKVAHADFPLAITFRYVGFYNLRVTFDKPMEYTLSVQMQARSLWAIPGGTVMAYGVKRITPKKIVYTWDYRDEEGKKQVVKSYLYRRRK